MSAVNWGVKESMKMTDSENGGDSSDFTRFLGVIHLKEVSVKRSPLYFSSEHFISVKCN